MTMQEVDDFLNKKIEENSNYIRITYYEVMVKRGVPKNEEDIFKHFAKTKYENLGYKVYFENEKYQYNGLNMTVQINELLVAIK